MEKKGTKKGKVMVKGKNKYIRFDWAAKYMLRSKADFAIFEGLINVLIGEKIEIVELLESESNQEHKDDKFNRVDIKAKDSQGRIIIVEIQQSRELDYLQRMLYGVAKTITEHMGRGKSYENVKKVYSINILYFDLGEGADYLYHGQTTLIGVHTKDTLQLTQHEQDDLHVVTPEDVFPEYFVIRVNEFNQLAVTPLEEWLEYLKDEYIRPDTKVPGLMEARERLEYLKMSEEERRVYDNYLDTLVRDTDVMKTKLLEAEIQGCKQGEAKGMAEGLAKGLAEGRAEGKDEANRENARKMKADGMPFELISKYTSLSKEEIEAL
jgi:predicted transposase/invertase (TIGR01784 family)